MRLPAAHLLLAPISGTSTQFVGATRRDLSCLSIAVLPSSTCVGGAAAVAARTITAVVYIASLIITNVKTGWAARRHLLLRGLAQYTRNLADGGNDGADVASDRLVPIAELTDNGTQRWGNCSAQALNGNASGALGALAEVRLALAVECGQGLALTRRPGLVHFQPLLELARAACRLLHVRLQLLSAQPLLCFRLSYLSFSPADPFEQRVGSAGRPPSLFGGVALGSRGRQDLGGISVAIALEPTDRRAVRLPRSSEGIGVAPVALLLLLIRHVAVVTTATSVGFTRRLSGMFTITVGWGRMRPRRSVVSNIHVVTEVIEGTPRVASLRGRVTPSRWLRCRHRRPGARWATSLDQLETIRLQVRIRRLLGQGVMRAVG